MITSYVLSAFESCGYSKSGLSKKEKTNLNEYVQKPLYIEESERVDRLLTELRKKKKPMAIVINGDKKSVGLITIEDLLEEIVGEIYDEDEIRKQPIKMIDDKTAIVDGISITHNLAVH